MRCDLHCPTPKPGGALWCLAVVGGLALATQALTINWVLAGLCLAAAAVVVAVELVVLRYAFRPRTRTRPSPSPAPVAAATPGDTWVTAWATAPPVPAPAPLPPAPAGAPAIEPAAVYAPDGSLIRVINPRPVPADVIWETTTSRRTP